MHVNAKKMAVAGLLAALAVLLITLGSVMESSTLFFLAAASFLVGIVLREWGPAFGGAFLAATALAGVLVSPNKLYCVTFTAMGLYLMAEELLFRKLAESRNRKHRTLLLWLGKYAVFNAMYLPAVLWFPRLFISRKPEGLLLFGLVLFGQAALFVYDRAHVYFQAAVWGKLRGRLLSERDWK